MMRVSLVLLFGSAFLAMGAESLEFQPRTVVNRVFDAITEFPVVNSGGSDLEDNELVLGVVINGASRAYPINMLTGPSREILNDSLGGRSIAATW